MRPLRAMFTCSVAVVLVLTSGAAAFAGGPGNWTKVSSGDISLISEPGFLRTDDDVLHIAFLRDDGATSSYRHTAVNQNGGAVGSIGTMILGGWDALNSDPKLVGRPGGGIRLIFSGIGPGDYSSGEMYTATGNAAGGSWSLYGGSMSSNSNAYASYGTGAVTLADGTPVASWTLNSRVYWHRGTSPTIPSPQADDSILVGDCCVYASTLVRDGRRVYVAWYNNGDTAGTNGIFVRQILPSEGATMKVPGSSEGSDSLSVDQAVAMATRTAGGVYIAFCIGYPTCDRVGLWKVGTAAVRNVPRSGGADSIALGAAPGGRLWVTWENNSTGKIYAVRTNTDANSFGVVRSINAPASSFSVYRLAVEGMTGRADIVINDGDFLWHQQVLPGLTLKASPNRWDGDSARTVTFDVTDAGDPVNNALIKVGTRQCTTGAGGTCQISFPSMPAQTLTAAATKDGSVKDIQKLTVLA